MQKTSKLIKNVNLANLQKKLEIEGFVENSKIQQKAHFIHYKHYCVIAINTKKRNDC